MTLTRTEQEVADRAMRCMRVAIDQWLAHEEMRGTSVQTVCATFATIARDFLPMTVDRFTDGDPGHTANILRILAPTVAVGIEQHLERYVRAARGGR